MATHNSNPEQFDLFGDGSPSAFYYFFKRHHSLLYQYIFLRCDDAALTLQFILQIFGQAWDTLACFESEDKFVRYLYLIAGQKFLGIEQSREQRRSAERVFLNLRGDTSQIEMENEDVMGIKYYLFRKGVAGLPKKQRIVFEKIYFEKKPYRQVADEMGLNKQTVLNQKSKAIHRLEKTLPVLWKSYLLTDRLP